MNQGHSQESGDGLRDVARWLTTPARCGLYLSSRDLHRVGESAGITGLPMNRRFAVEQLFRSAAIDEQLDRLFDALAGEVSAHILAYQECDSPVMDAWIAQATETSKQLERMRLESTG